MEGKILIMSVTVDEEIVAMHLTLGKIMTMNRDGRGRDYDGYE